MDMDISTDFGAVSVDNWAIETPCSISGGIGTSCMRSGDINDFGQTSQTWDLGFSGDLGGILTYRMCVSSEEFFDFLTVTVNGVVASSESGTNQGNVFSTIRHNIQVFSPQRITILVTYDKDLSVSVGFDAGFIDAVSFAPVTAQLVPDLIRLTDNVQLQVPLGGFQIVTNADCFVPGQNCLEDTITQNNNGMAALTTVVNGPGRFRWKWRTRSAVSHRFTVHAGLPICETWEGFDCAGASAQPLECNVPMLGDSSKQGNCICRRGNTTIPLTCSPADQPLVCGQLCAYGIPALASISGNTGWVAAEINIATQVGTESVVTWQFNKDPAASIALEHAWIDDIEFTPSCALPANCAVCDFDGCAQCNANFALNNGACVQCTSGTEFFFSVTTLCRPCNLIANCDGVLACSTATNTRCSSCKSGFALVAGTATTPDTCQACSPLANCTAITCSSIGASTCLGCSVGFSLLGGLCRDTDNCLVDPPCTTSGVAAACSDNPAPSTSATCTCPAGFQGTGRTADGAAGVCSEINPCQNPLFGCDANAACTNLPPPAGDGKAGRTCVCNGGFNGSGEPGQCVALSFGAQALSCSAGSCTALPVAGTTVSFVVSFAIGAVAKSDLLRIPSATYSRGNASFPCLNANPCGAIALPRASAACTCQTGASVGAGHRLTLNYCLAHDTNPNQCLSVTMPANTFSFVGPTLAAGTLLQVGGAGPGDVANNLAGRAELLRMTVTNFIPDAARCTALIGLGFKGAAQTAVDFLTCTLQPATSFVANNTFTCLTPAGGSGSGHQLTIDCDGQRSASRFNYSFPGGIPEVASVRSSGCSQLGNGLVECPSAGGVQLTVNGQGFASDRLPSVFVGGAFCAAVAVVSDVQLTCTLPPGAGRENVLLVSASGLLSTPLAIVSYAPPRIASISGGPGCVFSGLVAANCARSGGTRTITITGTNFGLSGATVRVGNDECSNVVQASDVLLRCDLASSVSQQQPLVVSVKRGDSSSESAFVSFALCGLGTFPSGFACSPCGPGQVTEFAGQLACQPCGPGTREVGGVCQPCPAGTFQNLSGQVACASCTPGTFADDAGNVECAPCTVGAVAAGPGALACEPCARGRFQPAVGQVACLPCGPGTFGDTEGRGECKECAAGRFQAGQASTDCLDCAAGSVQPLSGQAQCAPCDAGKFMPDAGQPECLLCELGAAQPRGGQTACTFCSVGFFSAVSGAVDCQPCGLGQFASGEGRTECLPCEFGRFTAVNASAECLPCVVGKFQNLAGQQRCEECAAGTFAFSEGQRSCDRCAPGTFANASGSTLCANCAAGRFQVLSGQLNCTSCSIGQTQPDVGRTSCSVCSPGRFVPDEGDGQGCRACPAGRLQTDFGASSCRACGVGEFQAVAGTTACEACAPGTFSAVVGQPSCLRCPAGRFQPDPFATSCEDCLAGFHTNNRDGQTACDRCPTRFFAAQNGTGLCATCGRFVSAPDGQSCLCPAGTFSNADQGGPSPSCTNCPFGTVCAEGALVTTIKMAPGFWRETLQSRTIKRCLFRDNCVGGAVAGDALCDVHRSGLLCAKCVEGFQASNLGGTCEACAANPNTNVVFAVLALLAVLAGLAFLFAVVLRQDKNLELATVTYLKVESSVKSGTTLAELEQNNQRRDHVKATLADLTNRAYIGPREGVKVLDIPLTEFASMRTHVRHRPNLVYKLKIVVSFMQVAGKAVKQGNLVYPFYFEKFLNLFAFLNFDFIPWASISCVVPYNYLQRALVVCVLPVLVLIGIWLFFWVPLRLLNCCSGRDAATMAAMNVVNTKKAFKLVYFTIFLIYPHVSSVVLGVFNCVDLDGQLHVSADFDMICYSPEYWKYAYILLGFCFVYPFGIPLFYLWRLSFLRKNTLVSPVTSFEIGFLFMAYIRSRWYFEVVDMLYKLSLTSIIVLLPNEFEVVAATIVVAAYLIFVLVSSPYIRKSDDRLHLLAQTELLLIYICGSTMFAEQSLGLDPLLDILLSILFIFLVVCLLIAFVILSTKNLFKLIRNCLHRRKHKKKSGENQRAPVNYSVDLSVSSKTKDDGYAHAVGKTSAFESPQGTLGI